VKQRQGRHLVCWRPQQKFQSKLHQELATAGAREMRRLDLQIRWFVTFGLTSHLIVGATVLAAKLRAAIYNTTSDHLPAVACPACRKS
jgi:hypothetical protein